MFIWTPLVFVYLMYESDEQRMNLGIFDVEPNFPGYDILCQDGLNTRKGLGL
jgi:hypothetical protein